MVFLSVVETQEYYTFAFKISESISTQTLQIQKTEDKLLKLCLK